MDTVILRGIKFELVVGPDAWGRSAKSQPVEINIELSHEAGFECAALEDDVDQTINYGELYKNIVQRVSNRAFASLYELWEVVFPSDIDARLWLVDITLPKASLLAAGGLTYSTRVDADGATSQFSVLRSLTLKQILCSCIIGVNPHERLNKQRLSITISVAQAEQVQAIGSSADILLGLEYQDMVNMVVERVEGSSYQTVEALASAVAQLVTVTYGYPNATVRIEKPSAIATIESAGVQVTRTKTYFENKDFWKVKKP